PDDLRRIIPEVAAKPYGGLIVIPDGFTSNHRDLIVKLAAEHRLPAIYPFRYFAASGGLVSYRVASRDIFRRSASYVDRFLKGETRRDVPVKAPPKFEFFIKLRSEKSLMVAGRERPVALAAGVIKCCEGGLKMKLPRRTFLQLAAGAAVLPAVSRIAFAQ